MLLFVSRLEFGQSAADGDVPPRVFVFAQLTGRPVNRFYFVHSRSLKLIVGPFDPKPNEVQYSLQSSHT
jgi:hypothetical protein